MPNGDTTGPHLTAALLCEKVLQEQDGALSVIRVIDQVTHTAAGADVPQQMPAFILSLTALIALKAGQARGRYAVKLRPEDPSGTQLGTMEMPVQFQGEPSGANLVLEINLQVGLEGRYWFDVLFVAAPGEERLLTRIPLLVLYQPHRTGPVEAPSE